MDTKETLLKKLSNKKNILELISEFGENDFLKEDHNLLNSYSLTWEFLRSAEICNKNRIKSVYYAIIEPYSNKIKSTIEKISSYTIDTKSIEKSIEEYLGRQISILSDEVFKCSIKKYMNIMKIKNDEAEEKFVYAIKNDYIMFESIFKNFSYWANSSYKFLEKTTEFLVEVFNNFYKEYNFIKTKLYDGHFKLIDIKLEVGDRHNGKFVIKFITSNGDLYYKPRCNEIELCLEEITNLLGKYSNKFLNIRFPESYSQNGHQWVKAVKYKALRNVSEEENYYYRLGEILALYYILDGNDLHFENLISSGEYPILIDVETLFTSRMLLKRKGDTDYLNKDENNYGITSVKDIGIIPHYVKVGDTSLDISSINFIVNKEDIDNYKNFNVDKSNLHIACQYISIENLEKVLNKGFEETYRVFLNNKEELASIIYELAKNLSVRFLKHPTNEYAKIKQIMTKPICFYDYSYAFAVSARVFSDNSIPEKIELCEQRDLLSLNIPKFDVKVNGKDISWNDSVVIKEYFSESPWESFSTKLDYLNEEDCSNQLKIIEMMFASINGLELKETREYVNNVEDFNAACSEYKIMIQSEYKDIINEIIDRARKNPITQEEYWIGYQLLGEKYDVISLPNSYYSGLIGLISILIKDEEFRDSVYLRTTVDRFLEILPTRIKNMSDTILTGVYDGLGMYIKIVQELFCNGMLKESKYNDYLNMLIDKSKKVVANDKKNDILNGNAGLLLALIGVLNTTQNFEIYNKVKNAAEITYENLLIKIVREENMCYFPIDGKTNTFFTGYGHGSSGIITALYKAMKALNKVNDSLIEKLLSTERLLYDKKSGVWYKDNRKNTSSWGWCHGIPGILLSRIELIKYGYKDELIFDEIHELIELSLQNGFGYNTTFCHGDMALITIIEYAYQFIEVDEKFDFILKYKNCFINNILLKRKEIYVRGMESIGLMDGLLGIAYFLMCTSKNMLPIDVLTMEERSEVFIC